MASKLERPVSSAIKTRRQLTISSQRTRSQRSFGTTSYKLLVFSYLQGQHLSLAWWRRIKSLANGQRRKGLDTLFALVSWQVWKERNARCFRDASATIVELLQLIKMEADRWIEAGAAGLAELARG